MRIPIPSDPIVLPPTVSGRVAFEETLKAKSAKQKGKSAKRKEGGCPGCSENMKAVDCLDWVKCPIYHDQYICEGCCIDISSISQDSEVDTHPGKYILEDTAVNSGRIFAEVQQICLDHQIQILQEKLNDSDMSPEWRQVREKQLQSFLTLRLTLSENQ